MNTSDYIFYIIIIISVLYLFVYIAYSINPGKVDIITLDKSEYLKFVPSRYTLPFRLVNKQNIHNYIHNIKYPIIFKPNICSAHGHDVKLINNKREVYNYLNKAKTKNITMMQNFYNGRYEVAVLYERMPYNKNGKIISIVEKIQKNKTNKWYPLSGVSLKYIQIENLNRPEWITSKFNKIIDKISKNIPDFYVGRYDIKFNNIKDLNNGINFKIVEVNGSGGVDLRTYTNIGSFKKNVYHYRWLLVRFWIGFVNLITFNTINPIKLLSIIILSIYRVNLCNLKF